MIGISRGIGLGLGVARAGGAAFVGAYDAIPNIVVAYGMRRLRSLYSGSLLRIRRSSDNAEQDIGYDGSGNLDTAAVAAFIGAGSGYVRTWYDQGGSYNAVQADTIKQPLYVATAQNGQPGIQFDGSNDCLVHNYSHGANPNTTLAVARRSNGSSGWQTIVQAAAPYTPLAVIIGARSNTSANWSVYYNSNYAADMSINNACGLMVVVVRSGRDFDLVSNGIVKTVVGSDYYGGDIRDRRGIGSLVDNDGYEHFTGYIHEIVICSAALSIANRQAAEAAANAYWTIY